MVTTETMFCFCYAPYYTTQAQLTSKGLMSRRVYSFNREDMDLFLIQHNFNIEFANITMIPPNEFDDDIELILEMHHFKSNSSDKIYDVMTCPRLVYDAIENVAMNLSQHLIMGPPIVRHEVEFILTINQLIEQLPHGYVLDYTLMDCGFGLGWEDYSSQHNFDIEGADFDVLDDSEIYQSLYDKCIVTEVQPITIEAYVKAFSEMIANNERQYETLVKEGKM